METTSNQKETFESALEKIRNNLDDIPEQNESVIEKQPHNENVKNKLQSAPLEENKDEPLSLDEITDQARELNHETKNELQDSTINQILTSRRADKIQMLVERNQDKKWERLSKNKYTATKAYVLITCKDKIKETADRIKKIDGIKEVHMIYGLYDIIAKISSYMENNIINVYKGPFPIMDHHTETCDGRIMILRGDSLDSIKKVDRMKKYMKKFYIYV